MARVVPVSSPSSVADLVPFKVMFWVRWKFPWQVPVITRREPGAARSILAWRSCREQFTWMVLTADALGAVMRSPAMRTAANGIKDSRLPIPCVFTRVLPPQIAGECPNGPAGLVSMALSEPQHPVREPLDLGRREPSRRELHDERRRSPEPVVLPSHRTPGIAGQAAE